MIVKGHFILNGINVRITQVHIDVLREKIFFLLLLQLTFQTVDFGY